MQYRITSKTGNDYGVYEGASVREAWEAMIRDGGGDPSDLDTEGLPISGTPDDWIITPVLAQSDSTWDQAMAIARRIVRGRESC